MAEISVESGYDPDDAGDPDAQPPKSRKLITQPYDLTVGALLDQIERKVLHLKPLSGRPQFQRRYVWKDDLASRLIESMLLNVPIPPCYFAQDDDFENEVIDGQQRLYSLYRFVDNQFHLTKLENLTELNGLNYYQFSSQMRSRIQSYTLRCVVITNDSDKDLRFDVFERLNSNTKPLNAQELRNCVYRGALIDLVGELALSNEWLGVFRKKQPDARMKDEELILRYFAFKLKGIGTYRTPQKFWLNDAANHYKKIADTELQSLKNDWKRGVRNSVAIFGNQAFRRAGDGTRSQPINKALVDLNMLTLSKISLERAKEVSERYQELELELLNDQEFDDLIARSVDHVSRTKRRFQLWNDKFAELYMSAS